MRNLIFIFLIVHVFAIGIIIGCLLGSLHGIFLNSQQLEIKSSINFETQETSDANLGRLVCADSSS
jgi:ABC-type lipoprotein release transport system permease subunit